MFKNSLIKRIIPGFLAVLSLSLSGCGNAIPSMDADVEQKVGEYAGLVMLRYDANHRSRLIDWSKIPQEEPVIEEPVFTEPEVLPEPEPEEDINRSGAVEVTDVAEEAEESMTPEEFLNLAEGMSLIYQGYSQSSSYPEDGEADSFALDASSGKKLFVVHFILYNQSPQDQVIDFLGDGYAFKCKINDSVTRTALVTMLLDDMSTYRGTVAQGYGEQLVLIFEIDESVEVSTASLIIKGNDGQCTLPLE